MSKKLKVVKFGSATRSRTQNGHAKDELYENFQMLSTFSAAVYKSSNLT